MGDGRNIATPSRSPPPPTTTTTAPKQGIMGWMNVVDVLQSHLDIGLCFCSVGEGGRGAGQLELFHGKQSW